MNVGQTVAASLSAPTLFTIANDLTQMQVIANIDQADIGLVEQAKIWVPQMRKAGADVVVVAAHSGADTSSSYGDALPFPENAATLVAQQVPGIDAILVGHAHQEIAERIVTNVATGKPVVLAFFYRARTPG